MNFTTRCTWYDRAGDPPSTVLTLPQCDWQSLAAQTQAEPGTAVRYRGEAKPTKDDGGQGALLVGGRGRNGWQGG